MPNTIRLIQADKGFPAKREFSEHHYWVFLGRDYKRLLELKNQAPANWHYVEIGSLLEDAANDLRRSYLDYVGELSVCFNSLAWWCSKIAEKNVMDSPVYLYICYLEVVNRLKKELSGKNVCIFSESTAVLETISRSDLFNGYKNIKLYKTNAFKSYLRAAARFFLSLKQAFTRKLWARKPSISDNKPLTILRTWIGDKHLSQNGEFKDSYFANLAGELRGKGETVAILPIFYNLRRSIRETFAWLRQAKENFIIADDYYRITDYFKGLYVMFRPLTFFKGSFVFQGHELGLIYREEARRTAFAGGSAFEVVMHYYLMERLSEKGVKIERIIITFENMFPEKPILLGAEKYLPDATILGFQHASLFPLLLSCYASKNEAGVLPTPNKIICSGSYFREILSKEGFSSECLVDGPALRFQYLIRQYGRGDRPQNTVLITLPLAKPNALELLSKSWSALRNTKHMKLVLKPHPMMAKEDLSEIINLAGLKTDEYELVGGGMSDVLPNATMLIATASATIFDALAWGVPVIRVRSDLDISLDPMDWFSKDDFQFTARTTEEIAAEIEKIKSIDQAKEIKLREKGRELIAQCFSPVNEESLAVFL